MLGLARRGFPEPVGARDTMTGQRGFSRLEEFIRYNRKEASTAKSELIFVTSASILVEMNTGLVAIGPVQEK